MMGQRPGAPVQRCPTVGNSWFRMLWRRADIKPACRCTVDGVGYCRLGRGIGLHWAPRACRNDRKEIRSPRLGQSVRRNRFPQSTVRHDFRAEQSSIFPCPRSRRQVGLELQAQAEVALAAGIEPWRMLLDPGEPPFPALLLVGMPGLLGNLLCCSSTAAAGQLSATVPRQWHGVQAPKPSRRAAGKKGAAAVRTGKFRRAGKLRHRHLADITQQQPALLMDWLPSPGPGFAETAPAPAAAAQAASAVEVTR